MNGRYCVHQWGQPVRQLVNVTWQCRRCGEVRASDGDMPIPGTFVAATEDFSNAVRNLGLEVRAALPGPLRRAGWRGFGGR